MSNDIAAILTCWLCSFIFLLFLEEIYARVNLYIISKKQEKTQTELKFLLSIEVFYEKLCDLFDMNRKLINEEIQKRELLPNTLIEHIKLKNLIHEVHVYAESIPSLSKKEILKMNAEEELIKRYGGYVNIINNIIKRTGFDEKVALRDNRYYKMLNDIVAGKQNG